LEERTKLKLTPEKPPNQFFTASKPRLEAVVFTGKKCTTLINSSIGSLILHKRL
jgi:hypothetical protein